MSRKTHVWAVCLGTVVGCGQSPADDLVAVSRAVEGESDFEGAQDVLESRKGNKDLIVDFASCQEFAGIGFVPAQNARGLVPAHYTLAGDATNAVIVVRAAQCGETSIDGRRTGAGTLSQIGISLVGPDTTVDINNYTLWYTTTSRTLADALEDHRIRAEFDESLRFAFEPAGGPPASGALTVSDAPRRAPAYRTAAIAQTPTAAPVPFTASWWQDGERRVATMRTTFPQISFGTAATTLTTAACSALGRLIGGATLQFPLLDSHNAFATAHMVVHQERLPRD